MEEDHIRHHIWKLARVEGLRPRRDGVARTVFLRTTHGLQIDRPIQLVFPLENGIDQGGEDVEDCDVFYGVGSEADNNGSVFSTV
jgi:hypothetical protein